MQPMADASESAAAVEGTSRPVSIALMPARESRDRLASSSCDQPSFVRDARTLLSNIDSSAMIVSIYQSFELRLKISKQVLPAP